MRLRLSKLIRLLCLFSLFGLFLQLFVILSESEISGSLFFFNTGLRDDFEELDTIAKKHSFNLLLFDPELTNEDDPERLFFKNRDPNLSITSLGLDLHSYNDFQLDEFIGSLRKAGFALAEFTNKDYFDIHRESYITVGLVLKRNTLFVIYILYTKEDNSWWFGVLNKDDQWHYKYAILDINPQLYSSIPSKEKLINKFPTVDIQKPFDSFLRPINFDKFLSDLRTSYFVPCNISRALLFHKKFEFAVELTKSTIKFKHRAWKLLTVVRSVFNNLSIPFWLSSGTCLGYYRQCSIIPYTTDVDIGVFASNYSDSIITNLEKQGIKLMLWLGEIEDSLELSFHDKYGIKLDIFFFYKEGDKMWNGGTQVRTGKKFKYLFPKFELCWTLFLTIKVRVPCDTESYILANYGSNWFYPKISWDWKKSPYNVKPNGYWPRDKLPFVIRAHN